MTANPAHLWAFSYASESSWGEDVATFGTRLELADVPSISLEHPKLERGLLKQYNHEGAEGFLGAQAGTVSIPLRVTGHGTTAAGALTATDLLTLLGLFFGGSDTTSNGGVADGSGTATTFGVDGGSEAFADGSICRVGAPSEARGGGQFYPVNTYTSGVPDTITLDADLIAAPNDGDVVYAAGLVYPLESTNAVSSIRAQIAGPDAQYECHGMFPQSVSLTGLNSGELPMITPTYGVSWFETPDSPITFPVATGTDAKDSAIVSEGSFFLQDKGTSTRQTYGIRSIDISIERNVQPIFGVDGVYQYQNIVGARDMGSMMKITATFDKPTAAGSGSETFANLWSAGNLMHLMYTMSATDGRALGLYAPNARIVGNKPTHTDVDGLVRTTVEFECLTNTVTTSALTLASWILAMA